jgi:zinc protease
MMDKSEAIVRMGHAGIARSDPDYYPCEVMNFILGSGSFTSRLMADLRDKQGLTYGAYSYFLATQGAGPFGIVMQVNPKDVDRAVSATRAEGQVDDLSRDRHHWVGAERTAIFTQGRWQPGQQSRAGSDRGHVEVERRQGRL